MTLPTLEQLAESRREGWRREHPDDHGEDMATRNPGKDAKEEGADRLNYLLELLKRWKPYADQYPAAPRIETVLMLDSASDIALDQCYDFIAGVAPEILYERPGVERKGWPE